MLLDDQTRLDVSSFVSDYDEEFLEAAVWHGCDSG